MSNQNSSSNDISIFNSFCGFITRHNEKPSKLSILVRLNGFHSTNRKYHTNTRHCFFPFMRKVASSSYPAAQRPSQLAAQFSELSGHYLFKSNSRFELQRLIIQQERRHLTPRNIPLLPLVPRSTLAVTLSLFSVSIIGRLVSCLYIPFCSDVAFGSKLNLQWTSINKSDGRQIVGTELTEIEAGSEHMKVMIVFIYIFLAFAWKRNNRI